MRNFLEKVSKIANQHRQPWSQKNYGRKLLVNEYEVCKGIINKQFGYYLLAMGEMDASYLLSDSSIHKKIVLQEALTKQEHESKQQKILGKHHELPIQSDSIDVLVLSHVIEQNADPRGVLREAHRVLYPSGSLIISGINQWSLYIAGHQHLPLTEGNTRNVKSSSLPTLKDWLDLLGFKIEQVNYVSGFSRANSSKQGLFQRSLNHAGYWLGGTYVIHARKIQPQFIVQLKRKLRRKIIPNTVMGPTARGIKSAIH